MYYEPSGPNVYCNRKVGSNSHALALGLRHGLDSAEPGCDGIDDASVASLDGVSARAEATRVPIYSIGIGKAEDFTYPAFVGPFPMSGGEEAADATTLHKLASQTGGMTFLVAIGDNGKALKQAANAIARDIGNHYIVVLSATGPPISYDLN